MRIGVDLLPMQSPGSRQRGVGRLAVDLLQVLIAQETGIEWILLRHSALPFPSNFSVPSDRIWAIDAPPREDRHGHHPVLQKFLDTNPARIDAYLNLNPFEACPGHDLPHPPLSGVQAIAFVHDLIPLHDQDRYLSNPDDAQWFLRRARTLKQYACLLTNSESTRIDCIDRLGLLDNRVRTVGAAADPNLFRPAQNTEIQQDLAMLRSMRVATPFIFHLGGMDERKNLSGLIDACTQLEAARRSGLSIVVAGHFEAEFRSRIESRLGPVNSDLLIRWVGRVDDRSLVALYRQARAFVMVSEDEGFGLPLLEAMQCGTPVIAGDGSAQAEVIGSAGLLVSPHDSQAIREGLRQVLEDQCLADEMRDRGIERARKFTWPLVAQRTADALRETVKEAAIPGPRVQVTFSIGATTPRKTFRPSRPRIAVFSPFSPKGSGIADYCERLIDALDSRFTIDLFHEEDYVPALHFRDSRFGCHDHRLFPRRQRVVPYAGIVYQMGNSWYHKFVFENLRKFSGIVTLHDLNLAGFHYWYGSLHGSSAEHFQRELEREDPVRSLERIAELERWKQEPGAVQGAAARRGIYLNRSVLDRSQRIIVHSPWCRRLLEDRHPSLSDRVRVVPLGAEVLDTGRFDRSSTRQRFGLSADNLIIGCFGILTSNKMDEELLDAFAQLVLKRKEISLVFVGKDWEDGASRRKAEKLGISPYVRFLGRLEPDDYEAMLGAVDFAVSLRRPPTFGETSASLLDCLRAGLPTLVNDAGTFGDIPEQVVLRLRWESEGMSGLIRGLSELASRPELRAQLSQAARQYVQLEHSWQRVASDYSRIIEETQVLRAA